MAVGHTRLHSYLIHTDNEWSEEHTTIIELTNTIQPPNNSLFVAVVVSPAVVNEISKLKDVEIL